MASDLGYRLFRNNVGKTWIGKSQLFSYPQTITVEPGDVLIKKARRFNAGLATGSGDLIGWSAVGKFTSIEIKAGKDTVKPEQLNWHNMINDCGGVSFIVRSPDDITRR